MFGNMDPEQMARVRETSAQVTAQIKIDHKEHEIHLKLIPTTPETFNFVSKFIPGFAETIATQLSSFFNIKGEIIDVGKK